MYGKETGTPLSERGSRDQRPGEERSLNDDDPNVGDRGRRPQLRYDRHQPKRTESDQDQEWRRIRESKPVKEIRERRERRDLEKTL